MSNLDVFCKVLSRVTRRPEHHFRAVILAGIASGAIPPGKLLMQCPDGPERVEYMVTHEAAGILNWLESVTSAEKAGCINGA